MPNHRRGPWSQTEDSYLLQLVHTQGAHNWVRISQLIQSRSPKQCRERFHQNLKPSLNLNPITPEEGALIERMVGEMGKRWAEIARRLHGRSDNAVKNWWNGGMNRRKRLDNRRADASARTMPIQRQSFEAPAPVQSTTLHNPSNNLQNTSVQNPSLHNPSNSLHNSNLQHSSVQNQSMQHHSMHNPNLSHPALELYPQRDNYGLDHRQHTGHLQPFAHPISTQHIRVPGQRRFVDAPLPSPSTISNVSRNDSVDGAPSLVSDFGSYSVDSHSPNTPYGTVELPPLSAMPADKSITWSAAASQAYQPTAQWGFAMPDPNVYKQSLHQSYPSPFYSYPEQDQWKERTPIVPSQHRDYEQMPLPSFRTMTAPNEMSFPPKDSRMSLRNVLD